MKHLTKNIKRKQISNVDVRLLNNTERSKRLIIEKSG